jgi:hypothetical protein
MEYNIQESSTVRLGITFDFYDIDTMDYPKLKTLIRQFNELRPQHRILLNQAEDKVRRRFKEVIIEMGLWVEPLERSNVTVEHLDDTATSSTKSSIICIEMETSSDDTVQDGSFMALENGFENLDISSAEKVFDEDNETDIDEARQRFNYELSTGQTITRTDAEFKILMCPDADDDDTLPITNKCNKSLFKKN